MAETDTHALYAKFLNFKPSRGDRRRVRILEKTIELIASPPGVEGVTSESLGRSLDMLRAHVAYYYPDRNALIEAAIKLVVSIVQGYTVDHVRAAPERGTARLEAFVNGTFAWARDFPSHPSVILLLYYYASFDPRFKKLHDDIRKLGARRIAATVSPLLPASRRRSANRLAKQIQSILTGHLVDFTTTRPTISLEALRKRVIEEILACLPV